MKQVKSFCFFGILAVSMSNWMYAEIQTNTLIILPVPVGGAISPLIDPNAYVDFTFKTGVKPLAWKSRTDAGNVLWNDKLNIRLEDVNLYSQFGRYLASSVDELEAFAVEFPNDANALTVLGVRQYQTNNIEQSIQALARARAADPDHVRSAELYSAMLVIGAELNFAYEENRKMLDRLPDNTVIRFNMACGLAKQTNTAEALYQLSVLKNMNWPDIRFHLNDPDLDNLRTDAAFQQFETDIATQAREQMIEKLKPQKL